MTHIAATRRLITGLAFAAIIVVAQITVQPAQAATGTSCAMSRQAAGVGALVRPTRKQL